MFTAKLKGLRDRIQRGRSQNKNSGTSTMPPPKKRAVLQQLPPKEAEEARERGAEFESATLSFNTDAPALRAYKSTVAYVKRIGEYDSSEEEDLCCICAKPPTLEQDLLQCATDVHGIGCCKKNFHTTCLGLQQLPPDEVDWICQFCTNSQLPQLLLRTPVGNRGHEIGSTTETEGKKPAAKKKPARKPAAKKKPARKGPKKRKLAETHPGPEKRPKKKVSKSDSDSDYDSEEEKPVKQPSKKNTPKKQPAKNSKPAPSKNWDDDDGFSDEADFGDDEDEAEEMDDNNEDKDFPTGDDKDENFPMSDKDEDFFGGGDDDDEDEDEEEYVEDGNLNDEEEEDEEEEDEEEEDEEEEDFDAPKSKKSKKRGAGVRLAGIPPATAKQQCDALTRVKLKAIRKNVKILQTQTTPITRSDKYDPENPEHQALVLDEKYYPWVIHSASCYSEQRPNPCGCGPALRKFPELSMWVASEAAKKHLEEIVQKENNGKGLLGFKLDVHVKFDDYLGKFESKKNADCGGKKKKKKNGKKAGGAAAKKKDGGAAAKKKSTTNKRKQAPSDTESSPGRPKRSCTKKNNSK